MTRRMIESEATEIRSIAAEVRDSVAEMHGVTLVEGDLPDPISMHPDKFFDRAVVVAMARARVQSKQAPPPEKPVKVTRAWVEAMEEAKAKAEREKKLQSLKGTKGATIDAIHDLVLEEREEKAEKEKVDAEARQKAIAQAVAETKVEPSPLEGITDTRELYRIEKRAEEILEEQAAEGE